MRFEPAEMSATARVLSTLQVLQDRPGVTAAELSRRLGVTERATRRHIAILREAGIPVLSTRGPYGGYRLGRGAALAPVVFTEAEALSLVMAVIDSHPSAAAVTSDDDAVGSALDKVVRALPRAAGREAAALREHACATPDRHPSRPDPATTSALVAASAGRRQVRITYVSESGSTWPDVADPWAVVVRHSRWYLLCRSHRADAVRTYRIDRIREVVELEEPFEPPPGLDPVSSLEEHLGVGWEFATRVVIEASVEEAQRWVHPAMGALTRHTHGCVLVGSTSNPAMYAREWLARIPLPFRVEGGAELVGTTRTLAVQLSAAVAPPAPAGEDLS
ncbi:helix-turn-helix transcriptional regulator [Knoellia sp. Soil729]|uniref:helix-turn-helix transcriptional regulator n=1 Tax=Knoellia sp. Soil729 TaxID=1736394 RepID=UPI0007000E29|nr:WYL domain-containing protein [Knoellia sp. Soil729]KRE42883.1 ArsR family transcriptional regulator [Knoellia sp. Soil729]